MAESEFAEQSEIFYNALITSRAVSALSDFRRRRKLEPDAQSNLRKCYELMRRISRAQVLVQTHTEKIAPELNSIHVYQHTREALVPSGILRLGESIGQAAERFAATLEAILSGKLPAEIDEHEFAQLEKAIAALASVYTNRTAVSSLSRDVESLLQLP